jgi:hypothetical protein
MGLPRPLVGDLCLELSRRGNEHSRVHCHDTWHRFLARDRLRTDGPHVLQQPSWVRRTTRLPLKPISACRYAAKDRWTSGALVHQVCQCRGAFDRTVVLVAIGEDDKATDAVAKSANAADAVFEVVGHIPAATLANWSMTEGEVRLVLPGEPISG